MSVSIQKNGFNHVSREIYLEIDLKPVHPLMLIIRVIFPNSSLVLRSKCLSFSSSIKLWAVFFLANCIDTLVKAL